MREILFRGRHKDNGDWLIGDLIRISGSFFIMPLKAGYLDLARPAGILQYLVDHETIGQYTGITDVAGNKIFEGDIVHLTNGYGEIFESKVAFSDGCFVFSYDDNNEKLVTKPMVRNLNAMIVNS